MHTSHTPTEKSISKKSPLLIPHFTTPSSIFSSQIRIKPNPSTPIFQSFFLFYFSYLFMASCGGLQQIFENPLPEKPTLIESLSWNQIKSMKSINDSSSTSSFTEIFGELHFKEVINPSSSSLSSHDDNEKKNPSPSPSSSDSLMVRHHQHQYMGSESLQLCTEGLGFESFDDVEEMKSESCRDEWEEEEMRETMMNKNSSSIENYNCMNERSRASGTGRSFPPPISCIGRSGKPWICFKSYRRDGRFVLKEVRIPTQEFLHACREDGRLRLHLVQPSEQEQQQGEDDDQEHNSEGKED